MSGSSTATPVGTAPHRPLSSLPGSPQSASGRPVRRVRHEVRDGVAVMVFSALASSGLAVLLTVLARLGN